MDTDEYMKYRDIVSFATRDVSINSATITVNRLYMDLMKKFEIWTRTGAIGPCYLKH